MAKERFSKLQKWILQKCLKKKVIYRNEVREFYGREFPGRYRKEIIWEWAIDRFKKNRFEEYEGTFLMWSFDEEKRTGQQMDQKLKYYKVKEEFIITRSEETDISRSLKGLIKKGILIQAKESAGGLKLTEDGFLKANK